jgi:hypothetical protein
MMDVKIENGEIEIEKKMEEIRIDDKDEGDSDVEEVRLD